MEILIVAILLGLIPAAVARNKGRSFGLWWLYGAAIFIVALPHALIMDPVESATATRPATGQRRCTECAEWIQSSARVCRFCGARFDESKGSPSTASPLRGA